MLVIILFVLIISQISVGEYVEDEEYMDAVINMLLNGSSREVDLSGENINEDEPVLAGGIWKCGKCTDLDEARLMYSEANEVDSEMMTDDSVDIQIGVTLPDMKCVTVHSDPAGAVRRVAGDCSGGAVTLSVAPVAVFTINVYS